MLLPGAGRLSILLKWKNDGHTQYTMTIAKYLS